MEILVTLWTEVIIRPMLNTLLVLYVIFFNNMGLAIVVFTVMVRLATLPLTLKQLRQMRGMTTMQPKVKEIQERYSGDRARISQETMKLYKESGISPFGCLGPMIPQMLVLFGPRHPRWYRVSPEGNQRPESKHPLVFRYRAENSVG